MPSRHHLSDCDRGRIVGQLEGVNALRKHAGVCGSNNSSLGDRQPSWQKGTGISLLARQLQTLQPLPTYCTKNHLFPYNVKAQNHLEKGMGQYPVMTLR
ncbi:hypothetical protein TNCV_3445741 [Trichonephila clavipes]|nr:hypothetical protein TNCV_3445741 [Trichonephila clavipes]